MATYQTGTTAIGYNWANVIGNTLDSAGGSFSSTSFFIVDADGNMTKVTGTGFTYNAGTTAVTGGTITELQRYVGGTANGEQISDISLNAVTFWADTGSQKLAVAFSGDDTFNLSQTQLSGASGPYAIDGYGGGGQKAISEVGLTGDVFSFVSDGAVEQLSDETTGIGIPISNINAFVGGSGESFFFFEAQPSVAGALSLSGGTGGADVEMMYTMVGGSQATLDLTGQGLFSIGEIDFDNLEVGPGVTGAEIDLEANQFNASGISPNISIVGDGSNDTLRILMSTATSFNAAGFSFMSTWTNNFNDIVFIDGSASSSNLTIVAPDGFTEMTGGSGNDSLQGGSGNDTFFGSLGNDTINGGGGSNAANYLGLTTAGIFAIIQGGSGTVNKGGANGTDQLTGVQQIEGSSGDDVFYSDANEHINGSGGFDYLIELSTGVSLSYGSTFTGISEFVLNTGANTISFANDTAFAYLYGSTGDDTLTLGTGGGYMFGEGGTNILTGGANATNIFEGGSGGSDTMNGGTGTASNFYYIDGNDEIGGAGAFNTAIELVSDVTALLGGSQYLNVQEFVADGGSNAVTVAGADSDFVYLYGGRGDDTLSTGSGGGYLFDNNGGTNVLTGGGGTNVFVGGGTSIDTMNGGSGANVYYTDGNDTINGAGTYNTDVVLAGDVNLDLGSSGVQQVILNSGTNSVTFAGSQSSDYVYGAGAGSTNTMTLGAGGGYELSTGGTNHMYGGTAGTDVFVGGIGTSDMHGGAGVNLYYVGANDSVAGAGTFNILLEFNAGVTETLGGVDRTAIQEVITAGGDNTIDATAMTTGVYLYGNSGNDLIEGGTASDYFYGSTGTNTFVEHADWGQDTIMDWAAGTNNIIDLTALAIQGVHSLADVTQSIVGGNDTITFSGNSLTLNGYGSLLTASSFHFA